METYSNQKPTNKEQKKTTLRPFSYQYTAEG